MDLYGYDFEMGHLLESVWEQVSRALLGRRLNQDRLRYFQAKHANDGKSFLVALKSLRTLTIVSEPEEVLAIRDAVLGYDPTTDHEVIQMLKFARQMSKLDYAGLVKV